MYTLKELVKYEDIQKEIFSLKEKHLYLVNIVIFLELTGILLNGRDDTLSNDKKKRRPIVITEIVGKDAHFFALSTDEEAWRKKVRFFDVSKCKKSDCEKSFRFTNISYIFEFRHVKIKNYFQPKMLISFDYIKLVNDIKTEKFKKIKEKLSLSDLSLGNIFEECGCCDCEYIDKLHSELLK